MEAYPVVTPAYEEDPFTPSAYALLVAGKPYPTDDPELMLLRQRAARLCAELATAEGGRDRRRLIYSLFGLLGEDAEVEAPLVVTYGRHLTAGDELRVGPGCYLLDSAPIKLGHRVRLGAGVHIQTATYPLHPQERAGKLERALPVVIGDDCWIGDRSVIYPGITIGNGTTVASGSVVTQNLPAHVLAMGNPAKVVREL